ncbi:MAG: Ig-like domain-containing protein [Ignavibacteriales bacterium]|nr:Ig-like domain-containing protein [Ignavibacteriales bacterium]
MNFTLRALTKVVPLVLIVLLSCKKDEPTGPLGATPTTAIVTGVVSEQGTALPLSAVAIGLTTASQTYNTTSANDGSYNFTIDLPDSNAASGTMNLSKSGYRSASRVVSLVPGASQTQDFQLQRDTTTILPPPAPGSGYANTIAYVSGSVQLAIYGVGGTESAILTFEARDSLGFPITSAVADTINFSITGVPVAGGAYVSPTSAFTNSAGRAATVVNSGTIAGTLQLTASLTRDTDGQQVVSSPVRILIHGGLPDQAHFSLGANPRNVFGYGYIGGTGGITVLVGDRFGNPVQPGTAVYFTTTQGVITTNSGQTNVQGFATVTIISGNPFSPDGFGQVTARTLGENGVQVLDSIPHLFSADPIIAITSSPGPPIVVDSTTQATITFTVYDLNLNPVAGGSTIAVEVTGGAPAVVSRVSPSNTIPDTQSSFWTSFSVNISKDPNATPTGPPPYPFSVTITVTTPGGIFGARTASSPALQGEVR